MPLTTGSSLIQIPFLLDFSNLEFDKAVIFFVSILLAITVNAEAQAFMATALGDMKKDPKDRFHFNPILHLDIAGLICFVVSGFGWAKKIELDTNKFKHPNFYTILVRFTGAFANLLLAGIAGSILWIMTNWDLEDQVFTIVVSVNIMVFVFNFIPIPPLAGASIFSLLFPKKIKDSFFTSYVLKIFPYVFVMLLILIKMNNWPFIKKYLYPVVKAIFIFISSV